MKRKLGANYIEEGKIEFMVWAPFASSVTVDLTTPSNKNLSLTQDKDGYWSGQVDGMETGIKYYYKINNELKRPDPASQYQPDGVHGASQVVNHNFAWDDNDWKGISLNKMIIYELHTGTFTPDGTFEGIIPKLDYLLELGVNAIEIMPVAQFPGDRNWGYDGVCPFAPQNSYGGVEGLKRLINACHKKGIAVVLDVVYNHLGPEGNYLNDFGPYFTDKYSTPWGKSLNFDDAYSDAVRNYYIQNALMWFRDYHIDALRLDAIHAIKDLSAKHFLQELVENVKELSKEVERELVLIGECDLNDPKFINPIEKGGFGLDGQWSDEFHHSLRSFITGEKDGYYSDFGSLEHLRKVFEDSFVYTGNYSEHRKKTFGAEPRDNPYSQFVVFAQNHDQIGNRMLGDRISSKVSFEALKVIAATYILSPYVPMLFMGEEYGEDTPFMFFISHTDKELVEAVRNGRKKEFDYFNWEGEVPDPQSEETFLKCKLSWSFEEDIKKTVLLNFYKKLIQIRKTNPAFNINTRGTMKVSTQDNGILIIERFDSNVETRRKPLLLVILNLGASEASYKISTSATSWKKYLDSSDKEWLGPDLSSSKLLRGGETLTLRQHSVLIYENS